MPLLQFSAILEKMPETVIFVVCNRSVITAAR